MFYYPIIATVAAVIAAIVIAVRAKKPEGLVYGKLDKAGRITNILLILVYACILPLCLFLGFLANPRYDSGILCVLGWIVAVLQNSAPVFCALGLGFSAALRKKGESKKSFAVQFLGFGGIALTLLLFFVFYGNLMQPLN